MFVPLEDRKRYVPRMLSMESYDADLKVVESYQRRVLQWAAPP